MNKESNIWSDKEIEEFEDSHIDYLYQLGCENYSDILNTHGVKKSDDIFKSVLIGSNCILQYGRFGAATHVFVSEKIFNTMLKMNNSVVLAPCKFENRKILGSVAGMKVIGYENPKREDEVLVARIAEKVILDYVENEDGVLTLKLIHTEPRFIKQFHYTFRI